VNRRLPAFNRKQTRAREWLAGALCAFCLLIPGLARAESESTVKAAYLLNFAKLVEWPASAFAGGPTLVIGIVGRDAVGDELARAGATANGRRIEVRFVAADDAGALVACHLVFIPESERGDGVLRAVQGRPVLVVGEGEDFARRGGTLSLVKERGTVKFEANLKAATRHGLTVSAKLLRVARSVVEQ
jgi:hypothetical protein